MKFLPTRSRSGFHAVVLSARRTCAKDRRVKCSLIGYPCSGGTAILAALIIVGLRGHEMWSNPLISGVIISFDPNIIEQGERLCGRRRS